MLGVHYSVLFAERILLKSEERAKAETSITSGMDGDDFYTGGPAEGVVVDAPPAEGAPEVCHSQYFGPMTS